MPAVSADSAETNTPPNDGHTWRKYGQKEIHGALHPRGYYRCTHKTDMGCPAVKQVQRRDEEDTFFDVTYRGYHTCRPSAELDQQCWPLASPRGLFTTSTSAHELSRLLSFSGSTAAMPAAASLMHLGRLSTAQQPLCNVASMAAMSSASQLSLGCSAGATSGNEEQLASLANEVNAGVSNAGYIVVESSNDGTAHHGQEQRADEVRMRYNISSHIAGGEQQGLVFSPVADWSSLIDLQQRSSNRPEQFIDKRPFTKISYSCSTMVSTASDHSSQPVIPRSYVESSGRTHAGASSATSNSSRTSMCPQMNLVTSAGHEQQIKQQPSPGIRAASSEQQQPGATPAAGHDNNMVDDQFGTPGSTTPHLTFDDMDHDNLLSDYFL